jgi:Protein of unknown function (DUF1203)
MQFIIQGLDPCLFVLVFEQKQAVFNQAPVEAHTVTDCPGSPCRITLDDAQVGQTVWLLSYRHHDAATPYAQSGPIFVTDGVTEAARYEDEMPPALARRTLSLRAYNGNGAMVDAIIVEGHLAPPQIERMFDRGDVVRIDAHNGARGCFAAHIYPKTRSN